MDIDVKKKKIKPLSYLLHSLQEREQDLGIPKNSFFLGAGCSVSSGIPSGKQLTEICQKQSFVASQGGRIDPSNYAVDDYMQQLHEFTIENKSGFRKYVKEKENEFFKEISKEDIISGIPSDLIKFISKKHGSINKKNSQSLKFYKKLLLKDRLYGRWFEEYSEDPKSRQSLIEKFVDGNKPNHTYALFAHLINTGIVNNIFTTNFDDLINDALHTYTNMKARVYSHNEIARYFNLGTKRPNIIKLHGDFLFEDIKNVSEETMELVPNMKEKFRQVLTRLDMIVVGFNGSDHSIMSVIEEIKKERLFRLIWCVKSSDKLHWRAKALINNTKNSYIVEVNNFETLVKKIWEQYGDAAKTLAKIAQERQDDTMGIIARYLNEKSAVKSSKKRLLIPKVLNQFKEIYIPFSAAMEYACKHDDGQKLNEFPKADIVLVGVSRTFKTPLSFFLAYLGYKVANCPIILDHDPDKILFDLERNRVIGLKMDYERLSELRKVREQYFGTSLGNYSTKKYVFNELEYADKIFKMIRTGAVIDVTTSPIEEIARKIIELASVE